MAVNRADDAVSRLRMINAGSAVTRGAFAASEWGGFFITHDPPRPQAWHAYILLPCADLALLVFHFAQPPLQI
uniref:Putative delta-cadiene synthase n=1 Tax=Triticum aestivum TaxID=4565 RepID=A0A182BG15_WHEAT|nr:putative delta-cadiene synthase [Triticum aestivum]